MRIKQKVNNKNINRKDRRYTVNNITYKKRFLFLGSVLVVLFLVITLRLYNVMLREQAYYEEELKALATTIVEGPSSPRGRILDRNGKVIVDNKAVKTIYYNKDKSRGPDEEIELAYLVSSHLSLDYDKVTDRNKREFFVAKNSDDMNDRITDDEWEKYEQRKLDSDDIYELKIERVTDDELNAFSEEDNKASYLYYLMNRGYSYDDKVIKNSDVTDLEYAYIAENNEDLPGFNTKLDWERVYNYGDTLRTILGNIGTIPSEKKDEYLAKGYSLNDIVGTSYLEAQYEEYLKGTKAIYKTVNSHELELVSEGKRGNDIVLTIDIELQQQLESILNEEVIATKREANTEYYDRSYAVIGDPNTGEVLAMAGRQVVSDGNGGYKTVDCTTGIMTDPMTSGSVVKGASMLVGYNTGAIKPGDYQVDECIKIRGTPEKCSWRTLGRINDIDALALSSNVYQFKTAMKVAGATYQYNMPLVINEEAFDIYRNTFKEFGLGVETGIDLPVESLGFSSNNKAPGLLLDFVMGQYDTYTPIQLSQYISTIANGGSRLQPHLLKEVHASTDDESLGEVIYTFDVNVLNTVNTTPEYLNRVKEGFYAVMHKSYGLGRNYMDAKYDAAGKTGTSQSAKDTDGDYVNDTDTVSTAFVGYAPSSSPKMSITVTSPHSTWENSRNSYTSLVTRRITKRASDVYFTLYP
ncbi:MAG TPA: penicillin-binding protein 2 [Candidatus Onthousia faecipullorum]|uniref:Penicillin-binding protein 2 n=1 Tax=Candidatus Onthousia faecipullorum TaxID=2840887 RepID=A0A9D1GCT2_9FIRM|nr:penicillin-binding protein 2 [Candidatus Onthousia faecipullorum]